MLWLAAARVLVYPHAPSSHDLVDDAYNHLQYGLVFALGYLLASAGEAWEQLRRHRHRMLLLAAVSYLSMLTVWLQFDAASIVADVWLKDNQLA